MKWVTRAGVRMDRAAMALADPHADRSTAEITILPEAEVMEYAEETGATPFHHPKAELRHTGTRTGFDALRTHFDLQDACPRTAVPDSPWCRDERPQPDPVVARLRGNRLGIAQPGRR